MEDSITGQPSESEPAGEQLDINPILPALLGISVPVISAASRQHLQLVIRERMIELSTSMDDYLAQVRQSEVERNWLLRAWLVRELTADTIAPTKRAMEENPSAMRLATAHRVTQLLAAATSFRQVIPQILTAVRENLKAPFGALWLINQSSEELYCAEFDASDGVLHLDEFVDETRGCRFKRGVGLPGRVWEMGKPVWFSEIDDPAVFLRSKAALRCGLVSGVATPILVGNEFQGTIELYLEKSDPEESHELVELLESVGNEIGQFIRRRDVENKLLDEEARKTAMLEASLDSIVTMDIEGKIVDFNFAAEQTFGYTRDQAIGRPMAELIIPPDFREAHRNGLKRYLETGEPRIIGQRLELTARRSDGNEFPVELTVSVSSNRDGSPFFTGYLRDISQIKESLARIIASEAESKRLAAVVENSNDFIGIATPDGRPIYVNEAGRRMVGLAPDAEIGHLHILDFVAPESHELMTEVAIPVVQERGRWRGEVNYRNFQTNQSIPTLWNAFVIEDPESDVPVAWVTISPDLTEHKRLESAIRESERLAQQANIAKTEFLANMSHEIRTPMTAILGYTDILAKHLNDPDDLNCISIIRENGKFLLDIINDILDISKIEAGKLELQSEQFDVEKLIRDVVGLLQVRARVKGLALEVELDGSIPARINSDPKRLKQILVNLLGNAIKFTDQGSVRLVIRRIGIDRQPMLQFEVADTGIGIGRQQLEKLFEPFTQADMSVDRKYGGTGLGLAISRRLAQVLGGDISVFSKVGQGSRFILTVATGAPSFAGQIDQLQWDSRQPVAASHPSDNHDGVSINGRILVVDDRREIRFIAQHFLEEAGAEVFTANDGQAGLDVVAAQHQAGASFDLVVIDMQMPVLDGYEATRRLRDQGFRQPIIALTAHAMAGDREKCLSVGCTDYITKPLDGPKFVRLVADVLNSSKG